MFTGLIQAVGEIAAVEQRAGTIRLTVTAPALAVKLAVGDSIAVSGVCLTALDPSSAQFAAELAAETVERTSLAGLRPDARVNLELPTPAGTPLGGHIVQGHVDATGTLLGMERVTSGERSDWMLRIAVPPAVGRYVVEKGSVAVEGISLTVARWFPQRDAQDDTRNGAGEMHIAIIPHTYEATNLHTLAPGDPVNLEADVLMKLAVENGPPAAAKGAWTARAAEDTTRDAAFEVTVPYLVARGY